MERFAKGSVTVCCDLTGYDIKIVGAALRLFFIDGSQDTLVISQPREEAVAKAAPKGELSMIACKCLMKIMCTARPARHGLPRAVGALTTMITRWGETCDRKLFRIINYTNGAVSWRQIGLI